MGMNLQFGGPAIRTANVSGDSLALEGFNSASGIYSSGAFVQFAQMIAGSPPIFNVFSGVITASGSAGAIGSGAVQSGNVGSGSIGNFHVSSGSITSGRLGTTGTPTGALFLRDDFSWASVGGGGIASGSIGSGAIASGAVQGFFGTTRQIASGTVGVFDFGSGAVIAGSVGSGAIQSGQIASGQISRFALASGAVNSGQVASGVFDSIAPTTTTGDLIVFSGTGNIRLPLGSVNGSVLVAGGGAFVLWVAPPFNFQAQTISFTSGNGQLIWRFLTAEIISGLKAVAIASGDGYSVVRAERGSGLRLPAIGVTVSGALSGVNIDVIVKGHLTYAVSGMIASGFHNQPLYVGSGGLIINKSGFMGGASSGDPFLSGDAVQKIGLAVSGGIWVDIGEPRSGYITLAGQGLY